jgi:diguanylate cyclase
MQINSQNNDTSIVKHVSDFETMEFISNSSGALVYVVDLNNFEILYANAKCKDEFGEVVGNTCYKVLQKDRHAVCDECVNCLSHDIGHTFERENQSAANNKNYLFNDRIIMWRDGRLAKIQVGIDTTKHKELECKIVELACYDPLTALPNRTLLVDRLEQLIQKSKRTQTICALLFIDLDDFKTINDTKGHHIGDEVIKESARRITDVLRQSDTACRLGGDEFVVLIDTMESDRRTAVDSAGKVASKILTSLKEPYNIGHYEFMLTASMGVSVFCGDEYSIEDLMKHADSAMYHAKENGRNAFNFFDPILQKALEEKAHMLKKLRHAIQDGGLELYYQTQVDDSGFIVGVEALARWTDDELGFVPPSIFIRLAEENNLIVPLGEWVIKEAVRQMKMWEQDETKRNWRISINISSKQFERRDFTDTLYAALLEYKAQPDNLRLEITESLLFKNTDEAQAKIKHLKELGITLSIDDFGTGYSSLSYLKQLPIDELKIDRSFISDITMDENDATIVQTIISIGRKFELEVIAEGVETKEQLEILMNMGCKNFQGYLFSKPVKASEL